MNRQIKFRAWDIINKNWFRNGDGFALSWDATEIYDDNDQCYNTKDQIIFEQFTGLLDVHGKEIYEGDIVAEIDKVEDLKDYGKPMTIGFGNYETDKDEFGISYGTRGFLVKYSDGSLSSGLHDMWNRNHYGFRGDELLVIGNIHENPELI